MYNYTKEEMYARRKKTVIRFFHFCTLGYTASQIVTLIVKFLGLSSISYYEIAFFSPIPIVSSLFLTFLIYIKKNPTRKYTFTIAMAQFACWLSLYIFWILLIREMRIVALFFSFMPLTFMLTTTNYLYSLGISIGAVTIQLSVSYVAIYHCRQSGNFMSDVVLTGCFFVVALFMSYLSGLFHKQRHELREAKKFAEQTRDALWGEMELAKKIQSILLPQSPAILGFDIAAYLSPAEEVGGDYYDVINVENRNWVIIGDVSGHGVPAGLVMMMAQTAIRTCLRQNPDIPPSELLIVINQVLWENIKKLGDYKYMTITVFAVLEEGRFHFSGLHQDIMIYRAKDQIVEICETHGMWVGIMDNVRGMMEEDTISLEKDDVMLLYTDGLTEACDKEGEMFSATFLSSILLDKGTLEPIEIKASIITALEQYKCIDDVTIVLVKRK